MKSETKKKISKTQRSLPNAKMLQKKQSQEKKNPREIQEKIQEEIQKII